VPTHAITFDFHNTLASCNTWFDLEVRHLVSAFLRWHAQQRGESPDPFLLAASDAAYRRLRRAIHTHGHELPAERCIITVLADLGISVSPALVARGVAYLMESALNDLTPVDGAIDTVRSLSAAGFPLGIISSAVYHPFVEWALERFGIREDFAQVTTSASSGYYKSRPEIFWQTLDLLGAEPSRSVHVGDSLRFDVLGAQRAGMRAVWLARDDPARTVEDIEPDLVLTTLQGAARSLAELAVSTHGRMNGAAPGRVPTIARVP
jgi:HAD superfamily hydrolase (TIGR01509 family)